MSSRLVLDQFLRLDCTADVGEMLREAVRAVIAGAPPGRRVFNFNTFDVTLDAETGTAHIADILDASDAGCTRVTLAELLSALQS